MGAQQHDDRLMGRVVQVHRAVDLGQPQLDTVPVEQRRQGAELVTGERPFVLADDHRVERPVGVGHGGQQCGGLWPVLPCPTARASDVEELRHDGAVAVDQVASGFALPSMRGLPILEVARRDPAVQREPQPTRGSAGAGTRSRGFARLAMRPSCQRIGLGLRGLSDRGGRCGRARSGRHGVDRGCSPRTLASDVHRRRSTEHRPGLAVPAARRDVAATWWMSGLQTDDILVVGPGICG